MRKALNFLGIAIVLLTCISCGKTNDNLDNKDIVPEVQEEGETEYIYTLGTPELEAAILTAISYDFSLSEIDESFYLKKIANIQILEKETTLYQIFLHDKSMGFITNDFLERNDFYYNPSECLDEVLYRSTSTSKGWIIDYEAAEEYIIIDNLINE